MSDFLIGLAAVSITGLAFGYLVYLFAVREGNRLKYGETDNAGAEEGNLRIPSEIDALDRERF